MIRNLSTLLVFAFVSFVHAEEMNVPLGGGVDLTLIRIEPGLYAQGSPESEAGRGTDETQRAVSITRAFYLGKFPVTRGQFARFVAETGFRTEAEKGASGGFGVENGKLVQRKEFTWKNPGFPQTDSDPVVIVSWNDAKAFLAWLSRKAGTQFDLPTEAQWEYACRAGTSDAYPGGQSADAVAWHKGNAGLRTHPVGQKALNAWGLGDMMGNVWEWCADWYGPWGMEMQPDPMQTNPNLSDKPRRVLRGGSFLKDASGTRAAARYRNDPQSRNADNGFRVMAYTGSINSPSEPPATTIPSEALERSNSSDVRQNSGDADLIRPTQSAPMNRAAIGEAGKKVGNLTGMLCCGLLGFGLLFFFIRKLFRGGSSSSMPSLPIPGIPPVGGSGGIARQGAVPRSRIVDDGFWLDGGSVPPGTQLKCRYVAGGTSQEIDVTYDARPGGQFVYTGQRPTSVSIVLIGGAAASSILGASPGMFDDDSLERRRREEEEEEEERRRRVLGRSPSAY